MVIVSDILLPKNADGILKVSDVSTSEGGDLSARTDPADPNTSQFIKADTTNNLGVFLGNAEGVGTDNALNATEYPVMQVGGFDGSSFRSLSIDDKARLNSVSHGIDVNTNQVHPIHVDATGNMRVSTVSTVNTAPANNANSGITDDPANSYAVGLRARTDIAQSNTETFLKCDATGKLEVVSSGGGGGDASAANQTNGNQKTQVFGIDEDSSSQVQLVVKNSGRLQCQIVGSNDINGGAPFRHLTIDANGRTLTNPLMTATNTAINNMSAKITQGSDATLSTAQQVLCYGKDQSGNLDPLNVDNNGHLKITLNDIEAGIVNSINVASKHANAYLQILSGGSTTIGGTPILTSSHIVSAGAGSVGGKQTITFYISTGSGTSDSNFSYEVHKSYDGTEYFVDSNFTFNPVGSNTDSPPVPVAAVVGNGFTDAQFLKVKITNNSEANATSINVYIIERQ